MTTTPLKAELWDSSEFAPAKDGFIPHLELYLIPDGRLHGAVVVCPGGGYGGRAPHEAGPIAESYNEAGFHAFVLHYRVAPNRHPAPLRDASRALRMIRRRAAEWRVSSDHVAILGFSAGGHLAATAGTHHAREWLRDTPAWAPHSNRPDALILCYPVITSSGAACHRGSYANLLGPEASQEQCDDLSPEKHVNAATPPAFVWSTAEDTGVPPVNSILFAQALGRFNIPCELHIFPWGAHGIGLGETVARARAWPALSRGWLKDLGWPQG